MSDDIFDGEHAAFWKAMFKADPNFKPATHYTRNEAGWRDYRRDDGSLVAMVGESLGKEIDKRAFRHEQRFKPITEYDKPLPDSFAGELGSISGGSVIEERMTYVDTPLALTERLRWWWCRVWNAISRIPVAVFTIPPKSELRTVYLRPGDKGYEDAEYNCTWQTIGTYKLNKKGLYERLPTN